MTPIRILFVCTGNTCRSPFAEVALSHFLKTSHPEIEKHIQVSSAGLYAQEGQPASLLASQVANTYHLDLSSHRSTLLTESLAHLSNLILCMTYGHLHVIAKRFPTAVNKTFLISHWKDNSEIIDPFAGGTHIYTKVFEHMMLCMPSIAQQVLKLVNQEEIS